MRKHFCSFEYKEVALNSSSDESLDLRTHVVFHPLHGNGSGTRVTDCITFNPDRPSPATDQESS